MVKLHNRTDQPLLISRGKASPLHLLARAVAVVEDREADSPQVRALVAAGLLEHRKLVPGKGGGRAGAPSSPRRRRGEGGAAPAGGGAREGEGGEAPPLETRPDTAPPAEPPAGGEDEGEPDERGETEHETEG